LACRSTFKKHLILAKDHQDNQNQALKIAHHDSQYHIFPTIRHTRLEGAATKIEC